MSGDLSIAIYLAIGLSLLIAFIEVKRRSDADLLACVSGFFCVYFLILAFGNSLTTLIASTSLTEFLPNEGLGDPDSAAPTSSSEASESMPDPKPMDERTLTLAGPPWLWYAFVGVFGFEVILKNMNVTMFGKGVLTINDWIEKARDVTVAGSIKSQAAKNVAEVSKLANALRDKLNDKELIAHAVNSIGHVEVEQLKERTAKTGGDENLALALAIVRHDVNNAKGIIKAANP